MASGLLITMAYVVFEGSLIGIFSYFFKNLLAAEFGIDIHWIVPALLMLVLNAILAFYDINITAKVLGVFLITEIIMLSLGAFAVLFHGGGPDGFAVGGDAQPDRRVLARGRQSQEPPQGSACSSRSGPGWGSSRRRCTARSRATRSASSRSRHHVQRRRHRPVLRVRLVDGGRGHRSAAGRRARAGRRPPRRHLLRARSRVPTASGRHDVQRPACHRILRVRHGLPQLRVALPLCAWPRRPFEADAEDPRRDTSQRTARRTSRRSCRAASRW